MANTKIMMGDLSHKQKYIELPEDITFLCPNCGEEVEDKGKCGARFTKIPRQYPRMDKTDFSISIQVDCENCGCKGRLVGVKL